MQQGKIEKVIGLLKRNNEFNSIGDIIYGN